VILNGNSRGHGQELARHLLNVEDNEHALVHELRGFLSDDLAGAFREAEAISLGTQCQQYLFSLSLNPPKLESVSVETFEEIIATIEQKLGLADQPRAIVFHEKQGRRHAHCVWSRIDVGRMRAINLPHFKRKLTDLSREIYLEHGWEMPAGLRNHKDRDPLNYSHAEAGQAKRAKRDPAELKALFQSCWQSSDSGAAFAAALSEHGLCLARGDRRGFVAVDAAGTVYSLSRWCGVKTRALRSRLGDGKDLSGVDDAIALLAGQSRPIVPDDGFEDQLRDHADKVAELVQRQRAERQSLRDVQEARRNAELAAAKSRLPQGLNAAWSRLTGAYDRLVQRLAEETRARQVRDRLKTQALVERHLAERRALDRELEFLRAKHALANELLQDGTPSLRKAYRPDPRQPLITPREDVPFTSAQLKRKPDLILGHISDKKASFSRNDIVQGLAEFIDDPLDLRVAIDRALASRDLVRLDVTGDAAFTTRDFQAAAARLKTGIANMAGSGGFSVNEPAIKRAVKRENARLQRRVGATLSNEQINAIQHVLAPNQCAAVVGLAGTGKSTLLSVAREAWEQQGYRVHGAALAGKAADSLEGASGIPSRTLASLEASWKSGYEPLEYGDILVIDEVGMVGTRQLARIAERLQQIGCKLVLVGDPDQLQPIQAGTPFKDVVDSVGAARLSEIRRQRTDWQRQASRDLADGFVDAALQSYADHGAVHEHEDRDQAIAALVDDYVADWKAHGDDQSRLALAHRRKDVHAINQAIRSARASAIGEQDETLFQTDHGPRAFAKGDRIIFTRNDRDMGVRNGMLGRIEDVDQETLTVRLDADDTKPERKLTFSPQQFTAIDHGFAVTIHRAQGCTVDRSFVLSSRTLDESLTYVAMTRHREKTRHYTSLCNAKRGKAVRERTAPKPDIHERRARLRLR
jgi:hypothetical protein